MDRQRWPNEGLARLRVNSMWLFLWGWAKEEVYSTRIKPLGELLYKMLEALSNIPEHMLQASLADI